MRAAQFAPTKFGFRFVRHPQQPGTQTWRKSQRYPCKLMKSVLKRSDLLNWIPAIAVFAVLIFVL